MFDWKEFFPVQAVAPLVGGLLLWFGFNYVYFAPSVIAPRLAQTYYIPACLKAVVTMKEAWGERLVAMDKGFEERVDAYRKQITSRLDQAAGDALGMVLGGSAEGQRLARQGQGLFGNSVARRYAQTGIEQEIAKARNEYRGEKQKVIEAAQGKQKFSDVRGFCACNTSEGLNNRVETSLYVSTLRIYKPDAIERLSQGTSMSETCGAPPLVN